LYCNTKQQDLFILGLEDAPEDTGETVEEEKVKQDEAPTSWEDVKEEDTVEADKDEKMKEDEAPFNWEDEKREETSVADTRKVPEARTEVQRTSNTQLSKKLAFVKKFKGPRLRDEGEKRYITMMREPQP
jgi:hypothetical protein